MSLFHEDLMQGFAAETLSWPMIAAVQGEGDVFAGDVVEGHFLGEELADQAIHIFVGTALPGTIGMGKEELRIDAVGDTLKPGCAVLRSTLPMSAHLPLRGLAKTCTIGVVMRHRPHGFWQECVSQTN